MYNPIPKPKKNTSASKVNESLQAHAALLLAGFFHAGNYTAAKMVMPEYLEPFGLIGIRVGISCVLFWIFHSIFIKEKVRNYRDYLQFVKLAFFGVGINIMMFFHGLSYSSPIDAAIINTTTPVLVLVVSAIILKEKITWLKMLGIALGATGAISIITGEQFSFDPGNALFGNLLIFLNALCYGTFLVLAKPVMQKYNPFTVYKWTFLAGTCFMLPFSITPWMEAEWGNFEPHVWGAMGFVTILATFMTFLLNARALKLANASVVGVYIYLQPVLATLIAMGMGQGSLTWEKVFLALLIFAGVYLVSKKQY